MSRYDYVSREYQRLASGSGDAQVQQMKQQLVAMHGALVRVALNIAESETQWHAVIESSMGTLRLTHYRSATRILLSLSMAME